MLNKIQVIYRLEERVVIAWSVRPNVESDTAPESYNIYWSAASVGPFVKIGSVDNKQGESRSYHRKVVFALITKQIPGWVNAASNYIRLAPVVGGVEQAQEDITVVAPYSIHGLRLTRQTTQPVIAVGFNEDENRFIPLSVDPDGKLKTI